MSELNEASIRCEISDILGKSDLAQLTIRKVKEQLKEAFQLDDTSALKPFKGLIKDTVLDIVNNANPENKPIENGEDVPKKAKKRKAKKEKVSSSKKQKSSSRQSSATQDEKRIFNKLRNICRYKGIDTTREGLNVNKMDKGEAIGVMKGALKKKGFKCDAKTLSDQYIKTLKKKYDEQKELQDICEMNSRWGVESPRVASSSRRGRNRKSVKYTYSDDEEDEEEIPEEVVKESKSGDSMGEDKDLRKRDAGQNSVSDEKRAETEDGDEEEAEIEDRDEAKAEIEDGDEAEAKIEDESEESVYTEDDDDEEEPYEDKDPEADEFEEDDDE